MIDNIDQLDFSKLYTYADYLTWQFEERVELIKGRIFKMSPVPNLRHQSVSAILQGEIYIYLKGKSCRLFDAPFDVRLPLPKHKMKPDKIDTVVQPDLLVVCDLSKLDEQGCNGAPDLIVEILSPGNSKKEMKNKYELYESAGVQEYWVVDPIRAFIMRFNLNDAGKYQNSPPFTEDDVLTSEVLKGFELNVELLFKEL